MAPLALTDEAIERVEALAAADATAAVLEEGLAALPADQREAVLAGAIAALKSGDRVEIKLERVRWSAVVLNATATTGIAADAADKLKSELAVPASADNAPAPQATSHVFFTSPAAEPYARTFANALEIAAVEPLPDAWRGRYAQEVVVVLGHRMR